MGAPARGKRSLSTCCFGCLVADNQPSRSLRNRRTHRRLMPLCLLALPSRYQTRCIRCTAFVTLWSHCGHQSRVRPCSKQHAVFCLHPPLLHRVSCCHQPSLCFQQVPISGLIQLTRHLQAVLPTIHQSNPIVPADDASEPASYLITDFGPIQLISHSFLIYVPLRCLSIPPVMSATRLRSRRRSSPWQTSSLGA